MIEFIASDMFCDFIGNLMVAGLCLSTTVMLFIMLVMGAVAYWKDLT